MDNCSLGYTSYQSSGFPLDVFQDSPTPCYYYDMELLDRTLMTLKDAVAPYPHFKVHYAVKANTDHEILRLISSYGLGADVVSGGELEMAIGASFAPSTIVFAGVGKADWEIKMALDADIGCLNVESLQEMEVINDIAGKMHRRARIAIRVNPNIDAHTHHFITTGMEDNKFGINLADFDKAVDLALSYSNIDLIGLHFHIGSQITIIYPYELLCERVNVLLENCRRKGIEFEWINLGGGLGIDYDTPDLNPISDFKTLMDTVSNTLDVRQGQQVHFEFGRSLVGQCGSLVTRVLYVKEGHNRKFVILDAGMSELVRPALYQAFHEIQNLSAFARGDRGAMRYDVVGPICETSDSFGEGVVLPQTMRGDIMVIRSAGAYGESMSSHYNCRRLQPTLYGHKPLI
mgnify:FL=1